MLDDVHEPADEPVDPDEVEHDATLPPPSDDTDTIRVDDTLVAEIAVSTGDVAPEEAGPPAEPVIIPRVRREAWDGDWTAQRIGAELRAIEGEIRELLGERDPRRKRKLTGTRRWHELQDDLVNLHYSGQYDEKTVAHIQRLVVRRHALFRRLRFLALTRPTWNS